MTLYKLTSVIRIGLAGGLIFLAACSSGPVKQDVQLVFPSPPDTARYYYQNTITGSLNVLQESEDDMVARYLAGTTRKGKGMAKPFGLATHDGTVYVSDPGSRKVHGFDFKNNRYLEIGASTDTTEVMRKPFGIDVDASGNLYVLDRTAGDIKIYNRDGDYVRKFGSKDLYDMPTGLAVNDDGSRVYVSDTAGVSSNRHQVLVFDGKNGELINTLGYRGNDDKGGMNLPKGLALSKNKELYVVDSGNFRILVFDVDSGEMVRAFGSIGRRIGHFARPKSIDVCQNGIIVVTDASHGNIQLFNEEGQVLMHIGSRSNNFEPAKYMLTSGVACSEDGRLMIADQYFKKVDVFRPAALAEHEGLIAINKKQE